MPRHTPVIRVAGVQIAPSWDGTDTAAIADLTITWGRSDLFDDPAVSQLTFSVIDPTGLWSGDPDLFDKRVTLTIPDMANRTVYQGDVSGVTSRRARVTVPGQTEPEWVWLTTITCADPTAALARARPFGPMNSLGTVLGRAFLEWYGPGYWGSPNNTTAERIQWIMDKGGSNVVSSVDSNLGVGSNAWTWIIGANAYPTLYDVIRLAYHRRAAGHVNYNPSTNGIQIGLPTTGGALGLSYTGGKIVLVVAGNSAFIVPASAIGTPSGGVNIRSAVGDAIDTATVIGFNYDQSAFVDPQGQATTVTSRKADSETGFSGPVPGRAPRNREVRWEGNVPLSTTGSTPSPTGDARLLLTELQNLLASVNGKSVPEGLFYDWERLPDLPDDIEALFLTTYDTTKPVYFAGAYTAGYPNHGPFYQLVGGTLAYGDRLDPKSGWRYDMTLAVAPSTAANPVTWTSWVTNATARYQDFDPSITWADLANVTNGAT